MRWERLFDEIEQQAVDVAAVERDALADDLVAETWRQTSWLDLAVGFIELDVEGVGQLRGEVHAIAELIELEIAGRKTWVDPARVRSVVISGRRRSERSTLSWRTQVGEAFGSRVRVWTYAGASYEGLLVNVGSDFVQIAFGMNRREVIIPRLSVSTVSLLEIRS